MSAIAESLRRQRLPLMTIAAVLVAAAGVWVFLSQSATNHHSDTNLPTAAPEIDQAPWKFEFSAEGRFGKLTKAQSERYANQKENVAKVVTSIYDGIFLRPGDLPEIIKTSFSGDAAAKLGTKSLTFPAGATEVKTTRRRATLGLDAQQASFAVGRVTVFADAMIRDRQVDIEHRSTLWFERKDGAWKVIAFDVEQGPVR